MEGNWKDVAEIAVCCGLLAFLVTACPLLWQMRKCMRDDWKRHHYDREG